uniref:CSON011077 protein n=1 Tax=Culicoides sonorensis TaxID=179676 RepID=A0A336KBN6_CULSO
MKKKKSNAETSVKVILDDKIIKPWCQHGPTLLFESNSEDKPIKFFACSACRSREDCPFYLEYNGQEIINGNENKRTIFSKLNLITYKKFQESQKSDRQYCMKCHSVFLKNEINIHFNHSTILIPAEAKPSQFLPPKSYDKTEAQYFFSSDSLNFFVNLFQRLSIRKVLCIGAPALFDELKCHKIQCFLLDLDERLFTFHSPNEFALYNMFNHHFFSTNDDDQNSKNNYLKFLQDSDESLCIFTDPPFGCMTEPLSDSLRKIQADYRRVNENSLRVVPIILVFPYFMEFYIQKVMPELIMSDYKVNYSNHSKYNEKSKSRKDLGSPVRFFSNIHPRLIELPKEKYKFCKPCDRFVAKTNNHCRFCGICPSKNAATYKHCKICHLCVKPNYIHCKNCNKCTQKSTHNCLEYKKFITCRFCKLKGHPEIECKILKTWHRKNNGKSKKIKGNCLICSNDGHTHIECPDRELFLNQIEIFKNK